MGTLGTVGAGKKYRERRVEELRRNPLSVKEQPGYGKARRCSRDGVIGLMELLGLMTAVHQH